MGVGDRPTLRGVTEQFLFATAARWFGPLERPLLGWWTAPTARTQTSGIVIAAPIGYEYWSAHRTLRALAEKLAERGHGVLRFDYDGLGDSAGERWDEGRLPAWRRSIADAVAEVRALGARKVTLIGLRMGATLALTEAASLGVDAVVAWAPVTSGKRFMKELRMLGLVVPASETPASVGNTITYAGTVFTPETTAAISAIDLGRSATLTGRVLVVARPDRPCDALVQRLAQAGAEVRLETLAGAETVLDVPTEGATVPMPILEAITDWVGDSSQDATARASPPARLSAQMTWNGARLIEEVRQLGDSKLIGVCGRHASAPTKDTVVLFLNSGSEPHIGPGRCWVGYARELNGHGYPTVRLDFSGWGESPDLAHAPGRPYDAHCIGEAIAVIAALRSAGHKRVVVAGLCAGAWIGMRAALDAHIDAVIAINPQLYWKPGEPLDVRIVDTITRRAPIRRREALLGKWWLWSALDVLGIRNYAGRWLSRLERDHTPVLLLFGEGDEGLVYLRSRLHRRLGRIVRSGTIKLAEVSDIDHQMYREWRRGEMVACMLAYLGAMQGLL